MAMMRDMAGIIGRHKTLKRTGGSSAPAPTGGPNVNPIPVQQPVMQAPAAPAVPQAPAAPAAAPAPQVLPPRGDPVESAPIAQASVPAASGITTPYAQTGKFGPGNDLRGTTIAPAEGANRYKIAGEKFDQFSSATNPEYERSIRQATKAAAAHGRLKSGMLSTDYGNLADRRSSQLDLARKGFLTEALEGSIGDDRYSREELRGERGFQQGQADRARGDEMSRFAAMMGGFQGNPAGLMFAGANSMGGGNSGAGELLAQWAARRGQGQGGGVAMPGGGGAPSTYPGVAPGAPMIGGSPAGEAFWQNRLGQLGMTGS
jgi:hypothetical protein